jgi:hypothetical protein
MCAASGSAPSGTWLDLLERSLEEVKRRTKVVRRCRQSGAAGMPSPARASRTSSARDRIPSLRNTLRRW